MKTTKTFRGVIKKYSLDYWDRILLIQGDAYKLDLIPRLKELTYNYGDQVDVRYWLCNTPQSDEKIKLGALKHICGWLDIEFEAEEYSYSEWTSGIDYNTQFDIGGHDLFKELLSHTGKYLLLEISFTEGK